MSPGLCVTRILISADTLENTESGLQARVPSGEVETRDKAYWDAPEPNSRNVQSASNTQLIHSPEEMPGHLNGHAGPLQQLQLANKCLHTCKAT